MTRPIDAPHAAPAPTIEPHWTIPLEAEIFDGAAVVGERIYAVTHQPPANDDPKRTIAFAIRSVEAGAAAAVERIQAPDGSPGAAVCANGGAALVAWFEAGHAGRQLRLIRRGAADDDWAVTLPAGKTPIGVPLLAPAKDGGWLLCTSALDESILCASVPAQGREPSTWRTLAPIAGTSPVRLTSGGGATWLVARCTHGACDGHTIAADATTGAMHDLGALGFVTTVSTSSGVLVIGAGDGGRQPAMRLDATGTQPIDLGTHDVFAGVPRAGGAWLVETAGWTAWNDTSGLGATTPWPRSLVDQLGGGIQSLYAATPDVVVLTGVRLDGVVALGVRLP